MYQFFNCFMTFSLFFMVFIFLILMIDAVTVDVEKTRKEDEPISFTEWLEDYEENKNDTI